MSPHDRPSAVPHAARCALLVGWCGVVWYLSDQPDPGASVGVRLELPDWALHGIEYAAGGFLARNVAAPLLARRGTVAALLFCVAWALTDEWHQSFVPGRDSAAGDVLADVVGALLGIATHIAWSRRRAA